MKKVVHTADWHLGAKLYGRDRLPEQRRFLDWLGGLLLEERPDLLVVAGDVFDSGAPSNAAQNAYFDFLANVWKAGAARHVLVLGGNHDSPSALGAPERPLACLKTTVVPEGARDAAGEAFAFDCADGGPLAVAAVPFLREALLRNAAPQDAEPGQKAAQGFRAHYRRAAAAARKMAPEAPLVLTGHCTVQGARLSDDISETARRVIGGVEDVGLDALPAADYVALGHLHVAQAVRGREAVRYAGAPIPMSFAEAASQKSVAIAEFAGGPGEPPRVRLAEVPGAQELLRLRGGPGGILAAAREYAGRNPGSRAWCEVAVTEGDGDLLGFRDKLGEVLAATGIELCATKDERPARPGRGRDAAAWRDLAAMRPRALALERLQTMSPTLPPGQIEEYMALFDEATRPGRETT